MAVIFGRLDLFTLWRSSSGRPAGGCSVLLSSEGLKMQARRERLPDRRRFRHRTRPFYPLKACRWTRRFVIDTAFCHPLAVIRRRSLSGCGVLSSSGGDLWPSGSVYPLAVIFRMQRFVIHGDGLKMQARRERLPDRRRFSSSTRPLSSSEGLKLASLPVDAAFRRPWRRPAGDPLALPVTISQVYKTNAAWRLNQHVAIQGQKTRLLPVFHLS